MINLIVMGNCRRVTTAVLQAIRSFTDAKCMVIGGPATAVLRRSTLCKRHITLDLIDAGDEAFVKLVNDIGRRYPHATILPADCDAIRMVSRVRSKLTLRISPIPDTETLDMFDNKWYFHQFCIQTGLPVPATRHLDSKTARDYAAITAELGETFVLKPLDKAGSTGVHIIRTKADYDKLILDDSYNYGPLIAQRYIDGPDIDISLLAWKGRVIALAIQQTGDSRIMFVPQPELEALATKLCVSSTYSGVMHIDARIEAATGKIFLIESNPRFWASVTASVWCGLNFVAESVMQSSARNGVHRLTSGIAYTRHPLIRPSSWRSLLADGGERGRLLRAIAFDPPALASFIKEFPAICWRYAMRRNEAEMQNQAASPTAGAPAAALTNKASL
jgi:hypothetical protein